MCLRHGRNSSQRAVRHVWDAADRRVLPQLWSAASFRTADRDIIHRGRRQASHARRRVVRGHALALLARARKMLVNDYLAGRRARMLDPLQYFISSVFIQIIVSGVTTAVAPLLNRESAESWLGQLGGMVAIKILFILWAGHAVARIVPQPPSSASAKSTSSRPTPWPRPACSGPCSRSPTFWCPSCWRAARAWVAAITLGIEVIYLTYAVRDSTEATGVASAARRRAASSSPAIPSSRTSSAWTTPWRLRPCRRCSTSTDRRSRTVVHDALAFARARHTRVRAGGAHCVLLVLETLLFAGVARVVTRPPPCAASSGDPRAARLASASHTATVSSTRR